MVRGESRGLTSVQISPFKKKKKTLVNNKTTSVVYLKINVVIDILEFHDWLV